MTQLVTQPQAELANMADAVAAGQTMQRVQTTYNTAISVQKPRELTSVDRMALQEAALMGEEGFYAWGIGKNHIEGPSIGLAMMLCRVWGNCALPMQPVQDLPDAWVFTGSFVDLETGYTVERQFRQAKNSIVYGNFDAARRADIRFEIGQSKCIRNVVLNALPKWLIHKALDAAKGGVRKAIEAALAEHGDEMVRARAIEKLSALGVSEKEVLNTFGRMAVAALTTEDLILLHGNIRALENGSDMKQAIFPPAKQSRETGTLKPEDLKPGTEAKRGHDKEQLENVALRKLRCPKCKTGTTWTPDSTLLGPANLCPECGAEGILVEPDGGVDDGS